MRRLMTAALLALITAPAMAELTVKDAWVRATVPQQKATGAFMQITAPKAARLVEASSPVAGVTEIHEMTMDKDIMRMRAIPGIDLPAGKAVELKPGGYHVMLMDLKAPITEGQDVPVTLVIEGADKKRETIVIKATARALGASGAMDHKH
ncbi:copper chaperone PCu(A)C [Methyloversatilis sp.]|uniref:copper chaperone PCu(A)C n=1 Tax=Methyloversatilis sp. TaxID=2569862 RepID=UPI002733C0A4|nr:copper chaperone PCu(A)C [Methyloversatilis sp.]MDP2867357.1 copper chaperone PCu(A)C [Methyloversatilis sp.]MDP3454651.1 copper chaperone PCu(A)C [Methyloversatilis sp.]MDP3579093.1 copper chaperone PCu(A)C [Methyloversatilis sp.]